MLRDLPEKNAVPVGYAALIKQYKLSLPMPLRLAAVSEKNRNYETEEWRVFSPRYFREQNISRGALKAHIIFALRYEGVNLAVFHSLFRRLEPKTLEELIKSEPKGAYMRRLWFLWEYLTENILDIEDLKQGSYADLLDEKLHYTAKRRPSKRHRIYDNLPGVKNFCPIIYRNASLDKFIEKKLDKQARAAVEDIHPDIVRRAAAFLMLEDSKSSFAIEGEKPSKNRQEAWARTIGKAGMQVLSVDLLENLQKTLIIDGRFVHLGYRREGGFIGTHGRDDNMPIPAHISAKAADLKPLMNGLIAAANLLLESQFPPVLAAAIIAFGFVFIHPFEDGNGRLHRYLMHHMLAAGGFTPKGVIFPVSSVILKEVAAYKTVLENYSAPRLEFIDWQATPSGNVEVLNDTIDLYRYFDAGRQAEFLFKCVEETVTEFLPREVDYLQKYDAMKSFIGAYIEMPEEKISLLIRFLEQGKGYLSARARRQEFADLTGMEIQTLEEKFADIFRGYSQALAEPSLF